MHSTVQHATLPLQVLTFKKKIANTQLLQVLSHYENANANFPLLSLPNAP